jgi:hypothetical protein
MFGGQRLGTRLGSDVRQTRHEQNTSPNARSGTVWGMFWGTRLQMLLVNPIKDPKKTRAMQKENQVPVANTRCQTEVILPPSHNSVYIQILIKSRHCWWDGVQQVRSRKNTKF